MVSPSAALRASQWVSLGFSTGMLYFPTKMMEAYKAETFEGDAATLFTFALGIFGLQLFLSSMMAAAMARDAVPKHVQSLSCFCQGLGWLFFALNDGALYARGLWPHAMPPESLQVNLGIFVALAAICFSGWAEGGYEVPDMGVLPEGRPALPLVVACANLLFFGVGCAFFTEAFVDLFLPGVLQSLPAPTTSARGFFSTKEVPAGPLEGAPPLLLLIFANAGKVPT